MCQGCTAHKSDRLPRSMSPSLYVVAVRKINSPGAHRHTVTTSRGACRAPQATVSRTRHRLEVRALTEFGLAAAFQATSARSERS
jgi:hypothetical protein